MNELTIFEQFKLIVDLVTIPFIFFTFFYMFRTFKMDDLAKKAKRLKITIYLCLTLSLLDLITANALGCSIWIFNAGLWVDSYFRTKSLVEAD